MIVTPTVTIDARDQEALLGTMDARRPGYVPEWTPQSGDAGRALEVIAARYGSVVLQRLNQAPEKNRLAFLGMLGERLAPAQAARAPIVFELASGAANTLAPAGTALSAPPPAGSSQPVSFLTESGIGLTAGKLTQVVSLWPGRDEYIDHSADVADSKPITLFDPQALVTAPHELYLSQETLLNLSGNVKLNIDVQLAHVGSEPLEMAWEYWDGQVWRRFAAFDPGCDPQSVPTADATNGFTASGIVRLAADCAKSDQLAVNGRNGYWIRSRLAQPLVPDPKNVLPEIESIRISSLVSQTLVGRLSGSATITADPILSLLFQRRSEEMAAMAVSDPTPTLSGKLSNETGVGLGNATIVVTDPKQAAFGQRSATTDPDGAFQIVLDDTGSRRTLRFDVGYFGAGGATDVDVPSGQAKVDLTLKLSALSLSKAYNDGTQLDTTKPFYPFGQQPQPGTVFYFANAEVFSKPGALFRLYLPRTQAPSDNLRPSSTTAAATPAVDTLKHKVVWEYWDGSAWSELANVGSEPVVGDFVATEILDFRVPADIRTVAVNDDEDFWMRARLVSGGYGFIQHMTFQAGTASDPPNKFFVLVTQPPILAGAALGYSWIFGPLAPDVVFARNDFTYADYTYELTWPGSSFRPFQTIEDVTPAVYLGFDAQPPSADLGIYFDIQEQPATGQSPPFVWEDLGRRPLVRHGGAGWHVAADIRRDRLDDRGRRQHRTRTLRHRIALAARAPEGGWPATTDQRFGDLSQRGVRASAATVHRRPAWQGHRPTR